MTRSLVAHFAISAALAFALTGCAAHPSVPATPSGSTAASTIPVGSSAGTLASGGRTRTYRIYRPASLIAGSPAPLVVFLHGGFGDGAQAEGAYGWDAAADGGRFVVVYPDGISKAWNGGTCCGVPEQEGVDDVGFIRDLVAAVEAGLPIDPARVYATGISNGGIMAYRLACETDLFAAVGPDSATQLVPCAGATPTSVIAIHGLADTRVPYAGGMGSGVGHVDGPAVPAVLAGWRAIDDCTAPSTTTAGAVTTSLAACSRGRAVELITVAGAGHQWPGGKRMDPVVAAVLGLDQPSTALDATSVIWAFFAVHPRA
ncbi:MAG TPA: PHB depolymerase family esterase [Candidatus Sulfotelmatobacter sp.]|nr:PHB depolymerase family esterase [Candidatus Sulfotelmatobacter sp.]